MADLTLDPGLDSLVSYYYAKDGSEMEGMVHDLGLNPIADSGAFSAFTQGARIELDDYAAWLTQWRPHLAWSAALDVFGDPDATFRNWAVLRDDHGLDTVPTLHIGADPALMDRYAAQGVDFLALGGMVGMPKPNLLRWLVAVLRYARDHHPHMRFHAWGITSNDILPKLPLYSVDSSGLTTPANRYGSLRIYNPTTRAITEIDLNSPHLHHHRPLLRLYGLTPADVSDHNPHKKHLITRLLVRSAQHRIRHLRRQHHVSAPTWGLNPALEHPPGTRMHFVLRSTDYRRALTPVPDRSPTP